MNAEFEKERINLRIGAEDENPAFEMVRTELGMEYRIHAPVPEVVFGVAWATEYIGYMGTVDGTWYLTMDKPVSEFGKVSCCTIPEEYTDILNQYFS